MWMHIDAAYGGSACICPEYVTITTDIYLMLFFNFEREKYYYFTPLILLSRVMNLESMHVPRTMSVITFSL